MGFVHVKVGWNVVHWFTPRYAICQLVRAFHHQTLIY